MDAEKLRRLFMVATKDIAGHIMELHGHQAIGVILNTSTQMTINVVGPMMTVNVHTKHVGPDWMYWLIPFSRA